MGSHLYCAYHQVRKHYTCKNLVFPKLAFPDSVHESDKQNVAYSNGTSQGLDSQSPVCIFFPGF